MTEQGKKNIVWGVFAAFMVFGIGGMIATHKPWSPDAVDLVQEGIDKCFSEAQSLYNSDKGRAVIMFAECKRLKDAYPGYKPK